MNSALHKTARIAVYILGTLIVLAIVGFFALVFMDDPLDSYVLQEVLAEPVKARHALVYEYVHADSSGQGTTVWITSDPPPAIGSRDREGEAALTWFGPRNDLQLAWNTDGRLLASIKGPHHVEYAKAANGCGWSLQHADYKPTICLHTPAVSLVED